jgi:hypothetical protein
MIIAGDAHTSVLAHVITQAGAPAKRPGAPATMPPDGLEADYG